MMFFRLSQRVFVRTFEKHAFDFSQRKIVAPLSRATFCKAKKTRLASPCESLFLGGTGRFIRK